LPSDGGSAPDAPKPKPPPRPVDFVKKVGRGRTLSQDLSREEAREAFTLLLEGAFTPAQLGAFLQALRIKELTGDELVALAGVFHGRIAAAAPLPGDRRLVLNLASDTARKGGMVSLLAARLLPAFGFGVGIVRSTPVLSGNRRSFESTLALWPLLESLGLASGEAAASPVPPPPLPGVSAPGPDPAAPSLRVEDCSRLIPGLAALDDLRAQLGFRSCLHTVEKLVNPWPGVPMLLGISHRHYALRLAQAMAALGLQGGIVLGNHGTVDLVLHKETEVFSVDAAGGIREESLSPGDLGLAPAPEVYSLAKLPEWGAWLAGSGDHGLRQAVRYQLAFFLWAGGAAPDPRAALALVGTRLPTLS
jgi:anthranilate phosphoribosyltransferase